MYEEDELPCATCNTAYETSLGRLSESEWNALVHRHAFGAQFVERIGRGWTVSKALSAGFPLFKTKREAQEKVDNLIGAEAAHRHMLRHEARRKGVTC